MKCLINKKEKLQTVVVNKVFMCLHRAIVLDHRGKVVTAMAKYTQGSERTPQDPQASVSSSGKPTDLPEQQEESEWDAVHQRCKTLSQLDEGETMLKVTSSEFVLRLWFRAHGSRSAWEY